MIDRGGDEPAKNVRNLIHEIRVWTEIADLPRGGRLQVDTKSSLYVIDFDADTGRDERVGDRGGLGNERLCLADGCFELDGGQSA